MLPYVLNAVLYSPMFVLQMFTWTIFIIVAFVLSRRSRIAISKQPEMTTSSYKEFRKNLSILALLFTFLGLPWLFIIAGAIAGNRILKGVVIIVDLMQGPALFLFRGVRLSEVRQLWKRVLCCQCCRKPPHTSSDSTNKII